jgi:DNA-binding transcriptional LysR family regulator
VSSPRDWIRQLDLLTLKIFLSAIEDGQIGRAAAREHLVASAATKRIQELESLAGIELLRRTAKGVSTSPAGEIFATHARSIFATLEVLRMEMAEFASGSRGSVVVSSLRWLIRAHIAQEIVAFAKTHAGVSVELREEPGTPDVSLDVIQGIADLGVVINVPGFNSEDLDVIPFRTDRLVAVLPVDHRLSNRQQLTFGEVLDEEFIGFSPPAPMMPALHNLARRQGREIKLKFSAQSVEVALSFVQAGLGVSILPACTIFPYETQVVAVAIDETWVECDISLITSKGRSLKPATRAFIAHLIRKTLPSTCRSG